MAGEIDTVLMQWPFSDGPETGTYITGTVWDGHEDLLYVVHDHEGDWQFSGMSGAGEAEDVRLICLRDVVLRFPIVGALAELPVGWEAEFDAGTPEWRIAPAPVDPNN